MSVAAPLSRAAAEYYCIGESCESIVGFKVSNHPTEIAVLFPISKNACIETILTYNAKNISEVFDKLGCVKKSVKSRQFHSNESKKITKLLNKLFSCSL